MLPYVVRLIVSGMFIAFVVGVFIVVMGRILVVELVPWKVLVVRGFLEVGVAIVLVVHGVRWALVIGVLLFLVIVVLLRSIVLV